MTHQSAVPFTMSSQDPEEKNRGIRNQPDFYPVLEKVVALTYLEDIKYIYEWALLIL